MSDKYKKDANKPSPTALLKDVIVGSRFHHYQSFYTRKWPDEQVYWHRAFSLLPTWAQSTGMADAFAFGEKKYEPYSWRKVPEGLPRYKDAAFRHFLWELFYPGDELDPESGLHHFSHAAASIFIVLDLGNIHRQGAGTTLEPHEP